MDIRYTPELLDEAVTRALIRHAEKGNPSWMGDFHTVTDAYYELPELERETRFHEANALFFRKLGLAKPLEAALAERPELAEKVAELLLDRANIASEEEADLMVESEARKNVRIRLRVVRFDNLAALEGFFRHELVHVLDILRPEFAYRPTGRIALRPAEENLVRARLRLLWNLTIAGAVARSGKAGAASRAEWADVAGKVYPGFPADVRDIVVAKLWDAEGIAWPKLLELARDAEDLLRFAGVPGRASASGPGALCPLCSFPTFEWAANVNALPENTLAQLREDFPNWSPAQGGCRQCIDSYELRVRFAPRKYTQTNIRV